MKTPDAAKTLVVLGLLFAMAPGAAFAQAVKKTPDSKEQITFSYAPVVKRAAPAVVNVYVRQRVRQGFSNPFLEQFFGRQFGQSERLQSSLGSGVIVAPNGVIVTNNHVVQGDAGTEIKVALADAREFDAKVLLRTSAPTSRCCRSRIPGSSSPTSPSRMPIFLRLATWCWPSAIPSASAKPSPAASCRRSPARASAFRTISSSSRPTRPSIPATPAARWWTCRPAWSASTRRSFSKSGGSQGIGFAIPANMVRLIVDSALQGGSVRRPWLGANLIEVNPDYANAAGLDRAAGALVSYVAEDSPASAAGLKTGDIIVSVDDKEVSDPNAFQYRFTTKGASGEASLEVLRGGTRRKLNVLLIVAPESPPRDTRDLAGNHPLGGAKVANLSPAVADELSITETKGVVVVETEFSSNARRIGIQPGDIVAEINGEKIENTRGLEKVMSRSTRVWRMSIQRKGELIRTTIAL